MADDRVNEMSGYLTRAELREELGTRDKRLEGIERRFDDFEQRMIHSLGQMTVAIGEDVGRQLRASHQQLRSELGADLTRQILASEERLRAELGSDLAGQIVASEERIRGEIRGLDDQYRDQPERLAKLEAHTGLKR
jgi:hypothetical protein